ncbi:iron uptake system protein EfeO [Paenibacillus sp. IHBB 10380]|uniref:iron uptake system protein EfeO n=1 Tax=Paenibacillus sp. IHBB 10380 TaxID=1566358 RepID=UPI0005CFA1D1|nr:iron uptake system protein EfeO [Paenibacillus sp. IHBB 10380]AJS57467.1 iron ABC transporter substrate-binding protein [Paenibacillus sp. IHBB 10380]
MKFHSAVPASLIAASILFTGCANKDDASNATGSVNESTSSADNKPTATKTVTTDQTVSIDFTSAIDQYRNFVIEQCDIFVKETEKFTNAVKEGKLEEAKALYAPTRMYYERIEPIAEALGDLDPNIDARVNDVEEANWRGFHRIEKSLWEDGTTDGQEEYADQLLKDAQLLRAKVETVEIDAAMMVTGAVELLNEISSSKVTGEEELYSHTDLYDFVANVEGASKIYEILKPALATKDADLEKQIGERFTALLKELEPFKEGKGYISYEQLKEEEVRTLSQNLDALAEPLSNMGTILGV